MMKPYYFSHDFYARRDPKIVALCNDFGNEGYGVFCKLIEMMHEQGGRLKKFPKLYYAISIDIGIEENLLIKIIEAMLQDYLLLKEDENYVWSERVLTNIKEINENYKKKADAGRRGGLKSGEVRSKQNEALLEANEANEANKIKLNENKLNQINNIYNHYQLKINKLSRLTDKGKNKINSRLKEFTEEELKQAIDNFSADSWWMKNNAQRGVAWFFHSVDRIDGFINLKPKGNSLTIIK